MRVQGCQGLYSPTRSTETAKASAAKPRRESSSQGRDHSVTGWHCLAFALAEDRDRRTVVVDCNLRRPQVAALLRTAAAPGVADVLRRAATLADVIWNTVAPNLFVFPAGHATGYEVGELLRSPALDDVMADLRHRFDYVLLDSPPIRVAPDVGFLGRAAPQALLVVRLHKTRRPSISKSIALLHAANITPLGLALTCQ